MGVQRVKIDISPEQIRQLATRRALGASLRDLEAEFGISRPVITRALSTELGRGIVKEVIDSAVTGAVTAIRRELADMSDLALAALRYNLEKKNMEAIKTYFKALGMDTEEKNQGAQQQAITVVLPGASPPKEEIHVDSSSEGDS